MESQRSVSCGSSYGICNRGTMVTGKILPKTHAIKLVRVGKIPFRYDREVDCWSFVFVCDKKGCNTRQWVVKGLTNLEAIDEANSHLCTPTPLSYNQTRSNSKTKSWAQYRHSPKWHLHICREHLCSPVSCTQIVDHVGPKCEHGEMEWQTPFD